MGLTTRRNYRLLLYIKTFGIVLFGALLAGWGVFWLFPAGLGDSYEAIHASMQGIRKVLFWRVALLYTVVGLPCVPAMVALHLFYSHRIAGPIFRLGKEADKIAQGDLCGNIKFRHKDNLADMADSLCRVASQYRGRIDVVRDCLTAIDAQSKTIAGLVQQGNDGRALRQAAEEILNNVNNLERSLTEIRT
jgi:methyl-accepting chemotaxis protein